MDPALRRKQLEAARLYFVCDAAAEPAELEALLGLALAGGVDVIQLRDKLNEHSIDLPASSESLL